MQTLPVRPEDAKAVRQAAPPPARQPLTAEQLRHFLQVAHGTAKHCGFESDRYMGREVYFTTHPITGEPLADDMVAFLGGVGASAGVGAWQRIILKQYGDSMGDLQPLGFRIFKLPNASNANQNNIMVECAMGWPTPRELAGKELVPQDGPPTLIYRYMCSGMTDYSGTGGRAWELVQQFIAGFAAVYPNCEVTEVTVNGDTDALMQRISLEIDNQMADYARAEGEEY